MTRFAGKYCIWFVAALGFLPGCKHLFGTCQTSTICPCWSETGEPADHHATQKRSPNVDAEQLPKPAQISKPGPPSQTVALPKFNQTGVSGAGSSIEKFYQNPLEKPGTALPKKLLHERGSAYPIDWGPGTIHEKGWPFGGLFKVREPGELPLPPLANQTGGPHLPVPQENRPPLVLALEKLLGGKHDQAIDNLKGYDPETQEVLLRLLPIVAQLADKNLDQLKQEEITVLNQQLQGLLIKLRSRTRLVIDEMCFCERIDGYGRFSPLPKNYAFRSSTSDRIGERVQIYVQLSNLSCERKDRHYETGLVGIVQILDQKGKKCYYRVLEDENRPIVSPMPRRDIFRNYVFHVPGLPPGEYILQVIVQNGNAGGRSALKSLPFRVGS